MGGLSAKLLLRSSYPRTCFIGNQYVSNLAAGLLLAALYLLRRALGDKYHVKAFIVLGALAFNTNLVIKDDCVRNVSEECCEGEGIVFNAHPIDLCAYYRVSWAQATPEITLSAT